MAIRAQFTSTESEKVRAIKRNRIKQRIETLVTTPRTEILMYRKDENESMQFNETMALLRNKFDS